jgi:hypothetical protein
MVLSLTRVCKAPFNDQQQTSSRKRPRHGDTSESMVSSKRVKGASATKRTYSEAEERVLQQASILGVDLCNLASKLNPASSGALNTFVSERIPPDYRHGSSNFPRSAEASCLSSDDVADSATAVYHASETSPLDDPTKVFDAQDYLEDSAPVIGAPFCIAFEPFADDIPFGFPEPPQQGLYILSTDFFHLGVNSLSLFLMHIQVPIHTLLPTQRLCPFPNRTSTQPRRYLIPRRSLIHSTQTYLLRHRRQPQTFVHKVQSQTQIWRKSRYLQTLSPTFSGQMHRQESFSRSRRGVPHGSLGLLAMEHLLAPIPSRRVGDPSVTQGREVRQVTRGS